MENPNLHSFLAALKKVEKHDGYYTACCPAHDDTHSSLSVTPSDDGKILVKCHCNCAAKDIVYGAGHTMKQMFPEKVKEVKKKMTATYDYFDAEGILAYQVCRMEWTENKVLKKTFLQRRPDGEGGFSWKTKGLKKIMYRLPEILAAPKDKPILIVEGEKQVDFLRELGFVATCNTGGAGKWLKTYGKVFKDRDVIVIPDADLPNEKTGKIVGAKHAVEVADSCLEYASSVHVVQLPNCEPKWGFDDWIEKGNHEPAELGPLVEACPQYPEGEIITEITPDSEEDMEDPLARYREMLEQIGVTYCAQTEDGRIEVFSSERRKFAFLPMKITYADLIKAIGLIVIRKIKEHAEDAGDISMGDIRVAIAAVSSGVEAIDDKRGQGCWNVDEGRIAIVNSGELGILNGRPKLNRSFSPMFDDKAYSIGSSDDWLDMNQLEEDLKVDSKGQYGKEMDRLVELISQFEYGDVKFRKPELIAGLLLASIVQACWPLRPQVFLIGQSYSGKTTLMMMLEKVLGKVGRRFSGPSAAGIRAFIKQSARVVMLDEMEKSKHRKEIFEMIRASARGDTVIRSSANQQIKEFSINNIFWCAAIEPGIVEEADKTRFLVIEMKKTDRKPEIPLEAELNELGECLSRLAICTFRDALGLIDVLKENPYSQAHGRLNECYAVPAAAYAAARGFTESEAITLFHDIMGAVDVDESVENDHMECLTDIFDGEIRNGTDLLYVGQELSQPSGFSEGILMQNGITKDMEFYYFNRNLMRKHILSTERYRGVRVDLLLMRFDGAERHQKRMGSTVRQTVRIPISTVTAAFEKKTEDPTSFNPFELV